MTEGDAAFPFPTFILSTPVSSIQGERRLGYLQIVVRADVWAATLGEALEFPGATGFAASLHSPGGYSLPLVPSPGKQNRPPVATIVSRFASPAPSRVPAGAWISR